MRVNVEWRMGWDDKRSYNILKVNGLNWLRRPIPFPESQVAITPIVLTVFVVDALVRCGVHPSDLSTFLPDWEYHYA